MVHSMVGKFDKKTVWIALGAMAIVLLAAYLGFIQAPEPDFIENMGGAADIDDDLIDLNQPRR